ncbi:MAG: exodeoxyribonuclease VII small subunit [bacterium]|nr:exodeoxyribonuclease VII small subunit [bacterium]
MDKKSFEEALKRLESIVDDLEQGDVPIEDTIKMFQEGVEIAKYCKEKLKSAENEIQKIVKNSDGDFQLTILPE